MTARVKVSLAAACWFATSTLFCSCRMKSTYLQEERLSGMKKATFLIYETVTKCCPLTDILTLFEPYFDVGVMNKRAFFLPTHTFIQLVQRVAGVRQETEHGQVNGQNTKQIFSNEICDTGVLISSMPTHLHSRPSILSSRNKKHESIQILI